jgi:glycine/D-amino acid oxidase-like deaminating enzyme
MGISGRPDYHRATVVGGGVIGISWTALFLAHGLEVTVCDPLPGPRRTGSRRPG